MQLSDIEMPDVPGWEEFEHRKNGGGKAAAVPIRRPKRQKPAPEAPPASLADVLMQAVKLAMARRGREPREILVREETLLEVLQAAMRRAE